MANVTAVPDPKRAEPTDEKPPKTARSKPTKTLPTERIAFPKQLEILRAYAAASGTTAKSVTNKEVADITRMAETTVSIGNAFFCSIGLLTRTDGGFLPSPDVVNFGRAHEWKPDSASRELAKPIRASWFAEVLIPKLSFAPLEEDEALTRLAQASAAGPEYRNHLRVCLEYMEAAGIIAREGSLLRLIKSQETEPERAAEVAPVTESTPGQPRAGTVTTSFAQDGAQLVNFSVSIQVAADEMRHWTPDRISALFAGIAQVITAKSGLEKKVSS
jgi:hypothetical protein